MADDELKQLMRDVREVHDYLLKETVPGTGVTRAKQLDEFLTAYRSGKFVARMTLWFAGFVVAIGAAWTTFQGWGK